MTKKTMDNKQNLTTYLDTVREAANQFGLTVEIEDHLYVAGLAFYAVKSEGIPIGRMYPSENGEGLYFPAENRYGTPLGSFDLDDCFKEILTKNQVDDA